MQLVRGPAIKFEIARARSDVGSSLLDRLAGVAAFELSKFDVILKNERRQSGQKSAAFDRGRGPPNGLECAPGGEYGSVDIFACAARDGGEFLPVAGIDDRDVAVLYCGRRRRQQRS